MSQPLGGNDIIRGLGGDDVICGGDGNDVIGGGSGNDTVLGENGNDSIWGGYENDTLRGGDGNDSIYGGPGDDNLYGNHGNDTLYGRSGDDKLYGGWGDENNDSCNDDQGTFIWGCEQFNGDYITPAPVPKTGQTASHTPGDDGDLQMGVPLPDPRFTDNGDGTVTDNLTRLIWLKNANCFGTKGWTEALDESYNLADGLCGLSDGSSPGDWRLPNVRELRSLFDYNYSWPALHPQHPFTNVQGAVGSWHYWTSTTAVGYVDDVFAVYAGPGIVDVDSRLLDQDYVWPVRGGN